MQQHGGGESGGGAGAAAAGRKAAPVPRTHRIPLSVTLDHETYDALMTLAYRRRRPASRIVEAALDAWLPGQYRAPGAPR